MTDQTREQRNHARATASEDASGGFREVAGCGCGECQRLATPDPAPSSETPERECVDAHPEWALARALDIAAQRRNHSTLTYYGEVLAALSADGWRVEREGLVTGLVALIRIGYLDGTDRARVVLGQLGLDAHHLLNTVLVAPDTEHAVAALRGGPDATD